MKLGMQVGLGHGHIVLDGDPAPSPNRGRVPQFSAYVQCGQTAGWIKMPLGTEVGLGPDDIVLDGTQLPSPKTGHKPQFSANVYCGQTAVCIRIPLGTEVDLSLGNTVLDGDPALPPIKGHNPQFSENVHCGQMVDGLRCHLVGLGPGDFVFSSTQKKRAQPHPILAHVCCGQTAGWMTMALGTEVNLSPGDIVLDGVGAPPKRAQPPSFRSMPTVAKGLDETRRHLVRK